MLELKVQDDGPGLATPGPGQTGGIGLKNTRARLSQLYGNAASLCVENDKDGGVAATVVLPCRILETAAAAELTERDAIHGVAG